MEPIKDEMECENRQEYRSSCCTGDRNSPSTAKYPILQMGCRGSACNSQRADPRRAAYNSYDNGEMRCVRIF